MIQAILVCLMGQVYYEAPVVIYQQPVCSTPVVIGAPIYIDYVGVVQPYRSKFYADIHFRDGKFRRVPIINGYVPGVRHTWYPNGEERIVYNYCCWVRYEDVKDVGKVKTRPRPPKPTLVPVPRPVPPKLKPVPRPIPERPPAVMTAKTPIVLPGQRDPGEIDEPRLRVRPTYRGN